MVKKGKEKGGAPASGTASKTAAAKAPATKAPAKKAAAKKTAPPEDDLLIFTTDKKKKGGPSAAEEGPPEPPKPTAKQIIGGQSWTGKLPVNLLSEHCQKMKWERPDYHQVRVISMLHVRISPMETGFERGDISWEVPNLATYVMSGRHQMAFL